MNSKCSTQRQWPGDQYSHERLRMSQSRRTQIWNMRPKWREQNKFGRIVWTRPPRWNSRSCALSTICRYLSSCKRSKESKTTGRSSVARCLSNGIRTYLSSARWQQRLVCRLGACKKIRQWLRIEVSAGVLSQRQITTRTCSRIGRMISRRLTCRLLRGNGSQNCFLRTKRPLKLSFNFQASSQISTSTTCKGRLRRFKTSCRRLRIVSKNTWTSSRRDSMTSPLCNQWCRDSMRTAGQLAICWSRPTTYWAPQTALSSLTDLNSWHQRLRSHCSRLRGPGLVISSRSPALIYWETIANKVCITCIWRRNRLESN